METKRFKIESVQEKEKIAEAAQILAIVYETTGVNPENVSIVNKG